MRAEKEFLKYLIIAAVILTAIICVAGNFEIVCGAFKRAVCAFLPFFAGLCIAFAVNIIMTPVESKLGKIKKLPHGLRRPVSLAVSFAIIAAVFSAVLFVVVPQIRITAAELSKNITVYLEKVSNAVNSLNEFADRHFPVMISKNINSDIIVRNLSEFFSAGKDGFNDKIFAITESAASITVNTVIATVFSVYVLAGKEKLALQAKRLFNIILPEKTFCVLLKTARLSADVFSRFLSGQFSESCIIGLLCFFGMKIFGFPYAAVSSVVIGFTALVPVFGAFIGTGICAVLIFMKNPEYVIRFIVFILFLQQAEGNIIYPRVVGKSVGLPGIWVLIATTVGGKLFGIAGMFFAVPVFSVFYMLLKDYVLYGAKAEFSEK